MGWGARCSSVVRAFAHSAMGHRIDPSWGGERDVAPWYEHSLMVRWVVGSILHGVGSEM